MLIFRSIIYHHISFDANAPGASDNEAYLEYISNRITNEDNEQSVQNGTDTEYVFPGRVMNEDNEQSVQNGTDTEYVFPGRVTNEDNEQGQDVNGEFIFTRNNEGIGRIEQMNVDGYDDSDEDRDETDNGVIIISSDDEDEEERTNFNTYRRMMGALSERSTLNLENFSSIFATSIIPRTISAATATSTTTTMTSSALSTTTATTTTAATTTTTTAATTRTPLQRCCICLINIERGGINLHDNSHSIHIFCLMDLLTANSQIFWLETSFRFDCPLCRKPVFGAVMMLS